MRAHRPERGLVRQGQNLSCTPRLLAVAGWTNKAFHSLTGVVIDPSGNVWVANKVPAVMPYGSQLVESCTGLPSARNSYVVRAHR